ncbi:lytic murein transglycosylase [Brackiella oedipodis]|uniref:lytic murein transglycosylase n=1 Tax=Brackiella oedipodis TaxID=124225 RepID=UPI00057177A0|nr:lytic murein transglycosylase [Brackiella oedipodis]
MQAIRQTTRVLSLATLVLSLAAMSQPSMAQESAQFAQCLNNLQAQASQNGVNSATYQQLTQGLQPDLSILDKLDKQPEFKTPIWDYMASLVDEQRIQEGKQQLRKHQATLQKLKIQYGVDPEVVVAVWGVESNYGQNFGKYPLIQALGTLSCYGRRQSFFRKEFFASLRIIQSGDIQADRLKGSWAGAFGHTQFMPSTFERLAVDGDGDGRRDLIDNEVDALASTANYLAKSGWRRDQPWGFEVKLPTNYPASKSGRKFRQPLSYWSQQGISNIYGQSLSTEVAGNPQAALLLPAGVQGPAFIVFKNFDAIYSYNASESYALAIAHLADRFKGKGGFVTPWPTDDLGLSRQERVQLQQILLQKGYDIGQADGMIGAKSRQAIQSEEQRLGLPVKGRAGQKILRLLQQSQ